MEDLIQADYYSYLRTGVLNSKRSHGIKNIPMYSEMRAIMSAFDEDILEQALSVNRGPKFVIHDKVYLLIMVKLFTVGIESALQSKN